MRNLLKVFGLIALAAVIGFSITSCPEPEDEGGPTTFGDKLEFSNEQVYEIEASDDYTVKYKPYTGEDRTGISVCGAVPKIVGGKFSFSVGVPAYQYLKGIDKMFSSDYKDEGIFTGIFTDVNISDSTARFVILSFDMPSSSGSSGFEVGRGNLEYSNIKTSGEDIISGSITYEIVYFVYVDKPVKITGKGNSNYNDLNLSLAKGWNTVCTKSVTSFSSSGSSYTYTFSVSNPSSVKWSVIGYWIAFGGGYGDDEDD